MSGALDLLHADTTDRQRRAADPAAFAWVSANAGAGKTKVLTDRVIRLLLAGTPPGRILCLTFTRAAAATMTARVFAQLGLWVTLDDDALGEALFRLEGVPPPPAHVRRARRLFAKAVETPGGLKIDTIHAFCERLLHLAPFEAGVPARFSVLDESKTAELMAQARAQVLAEAASGLPGAESLARALEVASAFDSDGRMIAAVDCAMRDPLVPDDPERAAEALHRLGVALGLAENEDEASVRRRIIDEGFSHQEASRLAEVLERGAVTDREQAALLRLMAGHPNPPRGLDHHRAFFFNKTDGKPKGKGRLATQAVGADVLEALLAEQARVVPLFESLQAASILARTAALFTLAGAVRRRFEEAKNRLGALDFDDLIARTLAVLAPESAAWVLYKLDRGIDHVLIDEAQDTNPDQWRILRRITEDFTAGAGAGSGRLRTLFAVGDPKQSIFSFQGADPRWFEDSRRHWERLAGAAEIGFSDVRLELSFRSAPAVLEAVDATFKVAENYKGLSYADAALGTLHHSARPASPGHVELWPIERRAAKQDDPDGWALPVDVPEPNSPPVVTANRVAQAVRLWTTAGDESGRVVRPGEILILSRKRGPAFFAVIRALRVAGVPVAGADRFDIGEHIAVLDLVAAGAAALLPDNDLALASALKSPLVGLTDDDLMRVAASRGEAESLRAALRRHAEAGDEAAARGHRAVCGWDDLARETGPFGFYAALLGPMGGRRRLISRLGGEAADAIDAFLCYAESAETGGETPSLVTFLARFEEAAHTIKRDLDAGGDEVRVMTVHGAKGLEAGIVIVIDGCDRGGDDAPLVRVPVRPDGHVPAWSSGRKHDCAATAAARLAGEEARMEEHNRLLYVAMTRAKDRLVIAPFATGTGEPPPYSWCNMIRRGFDQAQRTPLQIEAAYGPVEIWRDPPQQAEPAPATALVVPPGLPDWLRGPVEPQQPEPSRLRPSGAAAPPDRHRPAPGRQADPNARLIGTVTHALIERLPGTAAERREEVAHAFVAARAAGLPEAARRRIVEDSLAVLAHPALATLFGPGSRAEVALCGEIGPGAGGERRQVSGQIDRMAVLEDAVLIADFKTGAAPGPGEASPAAYLAQLALYRALLRQIYPDRTVRAFLVWTGGPLVVEPTAEDLDLALEDLLATA